MNINIRSKIYKGYTVLDNGYIISRRFNRPLSPGINANGYYTVNICFDGKQENRDIHRIIAILFIPNPENKQQVNHIDGNKLNNNVNNLEWVTASENRMHAYRIGLCERHRKIIGEIGKRTIHKAIKANKKPILNKDTGETYKSLKEASDKLGIKNTTLWHQLQKPESILKYI